MLHIHFLGKILDFLDFPAFGQLAMKSINYFVTFTFTTPTSTDNIDAVEVLIGHASCSILYPSLVFF